MELSTREISTEQWPSHFLPVARSFQSHSRPKLYGYIFHEVKDSMDELSNFRPAYTYRKCECGGVRLLESFHHQEHIMFFCFASGQIRHGWCVLFFERSYATLLCKESNILKDGWPKRWCHSCTETLLTDELRNEPGWFKIQDVQTPNAITPANHPLGVGLLNDKMVRVKMYNKVWICGESTYR